MTRPLLTAWLAVSGCQTEAPLRDPAELVVVAPFTVSNAFDVSIPRPDEIEDGDVVVIVVGTDFGNTIRGYPTDWVLLWEQSQSTSCTPWNSVFLRGVAQPDEISFDFRFAAGNVQLTALVIAYRNVRDPNVIAQRREDAGSSQDAVVSFAPSTTPAGSVTALLGVSDVPWQSDNTPSGLVRRGAVGNLVAYDATIEGPEIPPFELPLELGQCVALLQLRLQPAL